MSLENKYEELATSGKIAGDDAQRKVIQHLSLLGEQIVTKSQKKLIHSIYKTIKNKLGDSNAESVKLSGIYIHGLVGRGKSMLMDLFYNNLKITKKRRIHFHEFMISVHESLHELRKEQHKKANNLDLLEKIAKNIAKDTKVLCFDELQVTDIADAMIIGKLFEELLACGIIMVITSNLKPDDLYKDGLQRERFLPFIDIIKNHLMVLDLPSKQDYRKAALASLNKVFYWPLDAGAVDFCDGLFSKLTAGNVAKSEEIQVKSRKIIINKAAGEVGFTSFDNLCKKAHGTSDYITIAAKYKILIVTDIPKMNKDHRNEARRFINLIDILYENKVKLIASMEAAPELLYQEGNGSFEFQRTVSRLIEMQSEKYLS